MHNKTIQVQNQCLYSSVRAPDPACGCNFAPQTNPPAAGPDADTDPAGLKFLGVYGLVDCPWAPCGLGPGNPCRACGGGACQIRGLETGDCGGGDVSRGGEVARNAKTCGTRGLPWRGSGVRGVKPGEFDLDHAGDGILGAMPAWQDKHRQLILDVRTQGLMKRPNDVIT